MQASPIGVVSGTQLTVHSTLWNTSPLVLYQEPMRDIGFKLYPAALATLALIEEASKIEGDNSGVSAAQGKAGLRADHRGKSWRLSLHLKGLHVMELGAGACGVGAIAAAAAGAMSSVASDTESVLPMLNENVHTAQALLKAHALAGLPTQPSNALSTAAFLWGSTHAEYEAAMEGQAPPHVIIGADIVYYEELIDPLLHALKWLCTLGQGAQEGQGPPLIVLTYVQRVRKAKAFTKRATAAGFQLDVYQLPHVVDYDVLLHRALHPADRFALTPDGAAEPPPTVPLPPPQTAHFQSEDVWYSNAPEVTPRAAAEAARDAPEPPPTPPNVPKEVQVGYPGAAAQQPKESWEEFDAPLHLGIGSESDSDAFSDDSAEYMARTQHTQGAAAGGEGAAVPVTAGTETDAAASSGCAGGPQLASAVDVAHVKFCAPSKCFVYVLKFKGVPCSSPGALRAVACTGN